MRDLTPKMYVTDSVKLRYYEVENNMPPLVMIHGQGVDGRSFEQVIENLSQNFHVFSVDCYGHGSSLHDPEKYNMKDIADAISDFIRDVIRMKVFLLGYSSGGLIAACIAAETDLCYHLILEDVPLFSSQGEGKENTYLYQDLPSVCHQFINQEEEDDFVLYYFRNQYMWNTFPAKTREKTRNKMTKMAAKFRKKNPDENIRIMFWPENAFSGLQGMNNYDPLFGEALYNDSFHAGIDHEDMLKKIKCPTTFMKAKGEVSADGVVMEALDEADTNHVCELITACDVIPFDCGHEIHVEKPRQFINTIIDLL